MLSLWSWQPEDVIIVRRARRDSWLTLLLTEFGGWRLPEGAHAHAGLDGVYSVRLWKLI